MKKLRLLVTERCNRNCIGCCNKQWDLLTLPICEDFSSFDQIMLTGGEPMLMPQIVRSIIFKIRKTNQRPIFMYTAKVNDLQAILSTLFFLDGLTVTLHKQKDVKSFLKFNSILPDSCKKQLRLNIFEGIRISKIDLGKWIIKDNMKWIADCPLPDNEIFMRYR